MNEPETRTETAEMTFPDPASSFMSVSQRAGLRAFISAFQQRRCETCAGTSLSARSAIPDTSTEDEVGKHVSVRHAPTCAVRRAAAAALDSARKFPGRYATVDVAVELEVYAPVPEPPVAA